LPQKVQERGLFAEAGSPPEETGGLIERGLRNPWGDFLRNPNERNIAGIKNHFQGKGTKLRERIFAGRATS